jgi:hypothetical protein
LKEVVKKKKGSAEADALKAKMDKIRKQSPYIAVRRNLVYHYFGNRDPSILPKLDSKRYNMIANILKKLDMLWKHLVKITKVNIVVRDLNVLGFNILSNYLLGILQGRDPRTELKEQMNGVTFLHQHRQDNNKITELKLKIQAGNHTQKDIDDLKMYTARINKNPAKPLIDAGLYTSTTEELSKNDLHKEGYLDSKTNEFMDKVPKGIKDVFNVLYLTKETTGFKSLLLAMQYSDFAARYSGYYKLINKGVSHDVAIKKVLDNQINYGFGHGKLLQWLNARGAVMFTMFIEGIQRVIKNLALDKPFNVLMALTAGGV